jgi:hypothetical protein
MNQLEETDSNANHTCDFDGDARRRNKILGIP